MKNVNQTVQEDQVMKIVEFSNADQLNSFGSKENTQ